MADHAQSASNAADYWLPLIKLYQQSPAALLHHIDHYLTATHEQRASWKVVLNDTLLPTIKDADVDHTVAQKITNQFIAWQVHGWQDAQALLLPVSDELKQCLESAHHVDGKTTAASPRPSATAWSALWFRQCVQQQLHHPLCVLDQASFANACITALDHQNTATLNDISRILTINKHAILADAFEIAIRQHLLSHTIEPTKAWYIRTYNALVLVDALQLSWNAVFNVEVCEMVLRSAHGNTPNTLLSLLLIAHQQYNAFSDASSPVRQLVGWCSSNGGNCEHCQRTAAQLPALIASVELSYHFRYELLHFDISCEMPLLVAPQSVDYYFARVQRYMLNDASPQVTQLLDLLWQYLIQRTSTAHQPIPILQSYTMYCNAVRSSHTSQHAVSWLVERINTALHKHDKKHTSYNMVDSLLQLLNHTPTWLLINAGTQSALHLLTKLLHTIHNTVDAKQQRFALISYIMRAVNDLRADIPDARNVLRQWVTEIASLAGVQQWQFTDYCPSQRNAPDPDSVYALLHITNKGSAHNEQKPVTIKALDLQADLIWGRLLIGQPPVVAGESTSTPDNLPTPFRCSDRTQRVEAVAALQHCNQVFSGLIATGDKRPEHLASTDSLRTAGESSATAVTQAVSRSEPATQIQALTAEPKPLPAGFAPPIIVQPASSQPPIAQPTQTSPPAKQRMMPNDIMRLLRRPNARPAFQPVAASMMHQSEAKEMEPPSSDASSDWRTGHAPNVIEQAARSEGSSVADAEHIIEIEQQPPNTSSLSQHTLVPHSQQIDVTMRDATPQHVPTTERIPKLSRIPQVLAADDTSANDQQRRRKLPAASVDAPPVRSKRKRLSNDNSGSIALPPVCSQHLVWDHRCTLGCTRRWQESKLPMPPPAQLVQLSQQVDSD